MYTDDKSYGAFLSYHYSSDLDPQTQQITKEAVNLTRRVVQDLGYRIFDEHIGFLPGSKYLVEYNFSSLIL